MSIGFETPSPEPDDKEPSAMKPGWQTTECWHALIVQILTFCVMFGIVPASKEAGLESSLTGIVTGVFMLVTNAAVVISYVWSRMHLKKGGQP